MRSSALRLRMVRFGSGTAFKRDLMKDCYWPEYGTPVKVGSVPLRDLPNPPSAYGDPTPVEANGSTFWTLLHPRRIHHFGLTPSHCQSPGTQMNVAPALATWPSPGNGRW
jgi:hypothetical protein